MAEKLSGPGTHHKPAGRLLLRGERSFILPLFLLELLPYFWIIGKLGDFFWFTNFRPNLLISPETCASVTSPVCPPRQSQEVHELTRGKHQEQGLAHGKLSVKASFSDGYDADQL